MKKKYVQVGLGGRARFFMSQLPLRIIELVNWSVFVMCLKQEWIMQIEYL